MRWLLFTLVLFTFRTPAEPSERRPTSRARGTARELVFDAFAEQNGVALKTALCGFAGHFTRLRPASRQDERILMNGSPALRYRRSVHACARRSA